MAATTRLKDSQKHSDKGTSSVPGCSGQHQASHSLSFPARILELFGADYVVIILTSTVSPTSSSVYLKWNQYLVVLMYPTHMWCALRKPSKSTNSMKSYLISGSPHVASASAPWLAPLPAAPPCPDPSPDQAPRRSAEPRRPSGRPGRHTPSGTPWCRLESDWSVIPAVPEWFSTTWAGVEKPAYVIQHTHVRWRCYLSNALTLCTSAGSLRFQISLIHLASVWSNVFSVGLCIAKPIGILVVVIKEGSKGFFSTPDWLWQQVRFRRGDAPQASPYAPTEQEGSIFRNQKSASLRKSLGRSKHLPRPPLTKHFLQAAMENLTFAMSV